mmetsp:Transcript_42847/g.43580  ORF Transcript_42847/g.43580 Transcript_42847/m.43580 type:complete len:90 (+) Transcript_42847:288-557(+)
MTIVMLNKMSIEANPCQIRNNNYLLDFKRRKKNDEQQRTLWHTFVDLYVYVYVCILKLKYYENHCVRVCMFHGCDHRNTNDLKDVSSFD